MSGFPRAFGRLPFSVLPFVVVACAAPAPAPLDDAALSADASRRATTPDELAAALELAATAPLGLPRPAAPASVDGASVDFWRASAFAYDADVRAARRAYSAAAARAGRAGAAEPIMFEGDRVGFGAPERDAELAATFDLLGVLGIGRSAAARALADAESAAALGELEAAVVRARFRVERARAALAAARAARGALRDLVADDVADRTRRERLAAAGRYAPSDLAFAVNVAAAVDRERADLDAEESALRAELAVAAGLPPAHPALDRVDGAASTEAVAAARAYAATEPTATDDAALLRDLPELRTRKLAYAVAEARLRAAAAEGTPALRVGPKFRVMPDDVLPGGMLALELPWPGTVDGEVAAALVERDAARDAVVDALLRAQNAAAAARASLAAALIAADRAAASERAAEEELRARRAQFRADVDPMNLERTSMAFERCATARRARFAADAALARAALDRAEAEGDLR
jgi:hypothetical protein